MVSGCLNHLMQPEKPNHLCQPFSGCHHPITTTFLGSLKPLRNLQPMERRLLADILATSAVLLNTPFGDEPSPLHFRFQAALTI